MAFKMAKTALKNAAFDPHSEADIKRLFLSPEVNRKFQANINALLIHYGFREGLVSVKITWEPKGPVAYTDSRHIVLNAGCSMVQGLKDIVRMFMLLSGLCAHELAHVIWTSFRLMSDINKAAMTGNWYPSVPEAVAHKAALADFNKYVSEAKNRKKVLELTHEIDNICEDGFIEEAFLDFFVGTFANGLLFTRDVHYGEIKSFEEHKKELDEQASASAKPDPLSLALGIKPMSKKEIEARINFCLFSQQLLCYAKYGEVKVEDKEKFKTDPVLKALAGCLDFVDNVIRSYSPEVRRENVNEIVVAAWDAVLKPYLETIPDTEEEEKMAKAMQSLLESAMGGSSSRGSGSGKSLSESSPKLRKSSPKSSSSDAREKTKEEIEKASSGSGSDKDGKKGKKNSSGSGKDGKDGKDSRDGKDSKDGKDGKEGKEEKNSSGSGQKGDATSDSSDSDNPSEASTEMSASVQEGQKQSIKTAEGGRIPQHEGEASGADGDGGFSSEIIDADGDYSLAASEVASLLKEITTSEAARLLEQEREKTLNKELASMDFGEVHKGVSCKIKRIGQVTTEMISSYNEVAGDLERIAKRLAKQVAAKLRDREMGWEEKNLYFGKKFRCEKRYKDDGRYFSKKIIPEEFAKMAVAILVDESGSMSWGSRATSARAAAIVLYNFCVKLGLPCMVYGHTADENGWGSVTLFDYADFSGSYDKKDKYRLMDISARSNNRDGFALKYVYEAIKKRSEEQKIVFVISDGQPAASGYHGREAEEEMAALRKQALRKGITTFAAAIGSDKENIQRIYREGFLDITDLNELPSILPRLLLKYLKR
jgi:hypothetical protein